MGRRKLKTDWLIFVVPILIIDAVTLLVMGIIRIWSTKFLTAIPKLFLMVVTSTVFYFSLRRFKETRDWYVLVLAVLAMLLALLLLK